MTYPHLTRDEAATASMSRILEQKKWWRPKDSAEPVRRRDMGPAHKANTVALIVRNAASILSSQLMLGGFLGAPDEVANEIFHDLEDPEGWALSRPFVRACLLDLLGAEPALLAPAAYPTPSPSDFLRTTSRDDPHRVTDLYRIPPSR